MLLTLPGYSKTININLYNNAGTADNNQLESGETAGVVPVSGEHWNNIGFNNGVLSGAAAQRNQAVKDDAGKCFGRNVHLKSELCLCRLFRCIRNNQRRPGPDDFLPVL